MEVVIGLGLLLLVLWLDNTGKKDKKYDKNDLILILENDGLYTVYTRSENKNLYRGNYNAAQQYIERHTL